MAKCKFCGAEVTIGARCTYCGSKRRAGTILEKKRNRSLKRRKPHMIE